MTASGSEVDRKLLAAIDRLGRALRAARQQVATRHGLTPLQVQVLERLADADAITIGDLAAELDIAQPTVSDVVATLDGKGLVARGRSEGDRRVTVIALTAAGGQTAGRIVAELAPILTPGPNSHDSDRATALHVVLGEILRLQIAGVISINRSCLSCDHYRRDASGRAGRCLLFDLPLPSEDLRVDCTEHSSIAG